MPLIYPIAHALRRKTLKAMIPDFPKKLWFSVDKDSFVMRPEADYSGQMDGPLHCCLEGNLRWGKCAMHLEGKHFEPMKNGLRLDDVWFSPRWVRGMLEALRVSAEKSFRESEYHFYDCYLLTFVRKSIYQEMAGRAYYDDDDWYRRRQNSPAIYDETMTPALLWLTNYCVWYDSWVDRHQPMMVRVRDADGTVSTALELTSLSGERVRINDVYPMEKEKKHG